MQYGEDGSGAGHSPLEWPVNPLVAAAVAIQILGSDCSEGTLKCITLVDVVDKPFTQRSIAWESRQLIENEEITLCS